MFDYTISEHNLHLIDSWQIHKKNFKVVLDDIREENPWSEVWNKGMFEMRMEWASHNFLYALHIKRDRTKDCDLNYPQSWFVRTAYILFGMFAYIFIK